MSATKKISRIILRIGKIRSFQREIISSLAVFRKARFLTIVFPERERILSPGTGMNPFFLDREDEKVQNSGGLPDHRRDHPSSTGEGT